MNYKYVCLSTTRHPRSNGRGTECGAEKNHDRLLSDKWNFYVLPKVH